MVMVVDVLVNRSDKLQLGCTLRVQRLVRQWIQALSVTVVATQCFVAIHIALFSTCPEQTQQQ